MTSQGIHGLLRSVWLGGRRALGFSAYLHTPDRHLLEQVILPAYAGRDDIKRVLFVGCAPFTQHYKEFFDEREYWTIDPVARRRRYGSNRHIVDRLENLRQHVQPAYFDLIVCNGVLGWGLNAQESVEAAFAACHRHLRQGGELVVGWNDVAPRNGIVPDAVQALRRFERQMFAPLQTAQFRVVAPQKHVFSFYCKPATLL